MNVDDSVSFNFSCSGFEFIYQGEGTIRANLTTTENDKFAVDVDGEVTYYPVNATTKNIYLASDLEDGTHTIKVYKFLIIGASSTCGNQMDPDTGAENGYLAFPSLISRAYNATWQQISCSGRGIV